MEVERLQIHQNLESRLRYTEQQDHLVLLVQLDPQEQVEPPVLLVHQVHPEPLEQVDPRVPQEHPEQVVLQELQEPLEQVGHQVLVV